MDKQKLIEKYNKGVASSEEVQQLEAYIQKGEVNIDQLGELNALNKKFMSLSEPQPSAGMTSSFYQRLTEAQSKKQSSSVFGWLAGLWQEKPAYQWAYTLVLLAVGAAAGYLIQPQESPSTEIKQLSAEVTEMKEMMMLSLLEQESTSDRLKAVNLTSELPEASKKVTQALLKTLNSDENVNVRLATIDALYPYASDPKVRQGLIKSIARQESPLVQIALAEMMVALQEKRSVNELEQILKKEETPDEVKDRIKESIKVLI